MEDNNQQNLKDENFKQFLEELPDNKEFQEGVVYLYFKEQPLLINFNQEQDPQKILQNALAWKQLSVNDEPRPIDANKSGGKELLDKRIVQTLRNTAKQTITLIGKKILSGDFNLTTVSFPIRCMIPCSALEKALSSATYFPIFVNRAAQISDPIERVKLVISACIANFFVNCTFMKPLNPILGETCQASFQDGTTLYAEQISHHPPVSCFYVEGPNKLYKYYGNYNYLSKAGLNSLTLKNNGGRNIIFKDGQHITYNYAKEVYSGTFTGTMRLESQGKLEFYDNLNGIAATINLESKVKGKPSDYFKGEIKQFNQTISNVTGSYLAFVEFDGKRYWDFRYTEPFELKVNQNSALASDQCYRMDKNLLLRGHIEEAQTRKEQLEQSQREDAKLRKEVLAAKEKEKKKK